jgi:hypothetical protein
MISAAQLSRRGMLVGVGATLLCAPAMVRATNLMPVRRILLKSDVNYYGWIDRLWASQYFSTIIERQNAGLSAKEIAAEMNAKGYKPPSAGPGETTEWDARRVLGKIRHNEDIRRTDTIIAALRAGALVYASDFPEVAPVEKSWPMKSICRMVRCTMLKRKRAGLLSTRRRMGEGVAKAGSPIEAGRP